MASDLKIEIFAYTLFHETWLQMGMVKVKPNIFQVYGEECCKVEKIYEACEDLYIEPVTSRRRLFKGIYLADLTCGKAKSLKSPYECYNYVISVCDRDDLFGDLTIFEKMFATCAFVLNFCICIHQYSIVDVIEYGHMFWAMYFDKFTEEFYKEGGWPELKKVAETYIGVDGFLCRFKEESFFLLRDAIDNYFNFKASNQYYEYKSNQKEIYATKFWIKFCIEEFESFKTTPVTDEYPFEAYEVEELLEDLKEIFEIISEENTVSSDNECSEIFSDHADNETDINGGARMKQLPERRCETPNASKVQFSNKMHENLGYAKSPSYNVPGAMVYCSGNKEVNTEETFETSGSLKNGDDRKEIDNRTGNIPARRLSESKCNENIHNLYSRIIDIQCETSNVTEVLSTNHMDKSLHLSRPSRITDMTSICSQNAVISVNDDVSKEKTSDVIHYSKNRDDQTKITKRTGISSASKMTSSELNENIFLHLPLTKQFIDICMDNLYASNKESPKEDPNASEILSTIQMAESERDGKTELPIPKILNPVRCENSEDEMRKVDKARKDLRKEQKDHSIKIFLRMILVLGDRLGMKYVFQAFQSNERRRKLC